jgi:hypothetical protein
MSRYRITGVSITEKDIVLTLADGRTLATPIRRYIRVEKATREERQGWVLADGGHGVNWPALWEPHPQGMVSVWDILQDTLYEGALGRLKDAGWDVSAVTKRDHALVALWRAEADINNGGFLQFLGNWGEDNLLVAMAALEAIGAKEAVRILRAMYAVVEPYGQTEEVVSLAQLPGLLTEAERDHLYELDQAFWDYPDPLPRLVVEHYGADVGAA